MHFPSGDQTQTCATSGDDILVRLSFNNNHLWQPFVGLIALIVLYNFAGYLFLRRSKPK